MWRDLAHQLGLTTTAPASAGDIAAAEATVGCALPQALRQLLEETDGLHGEYGEEVVFSAGEVARHNDEMRTTDGFAEFYMPFNCLLFIGSEGNGDLYAFPILESSPAAPKLSPSSSGITRPTAGPPSPQGLPATSATSCGDEASAARSAL